MLELLKALIEIPSISREEAAAADYLQAAMASMGLEPKRVGNNLWCSCGSGPYTVLLNAHIDTVRPCSGWTFDPFKATADGDRLYGLGSNDDGASLVALLYAYKELYAKNLPFRLIFSATAEEEVSGRGGLETVFPEIGHVDCAVIGEPTGMAMGIAERGLMVLDCTASGVSGHAAHGNGVNAIYKAMEDISWFKTYKFPKVSPLLGQVGMNVTQINAGTAHNVIPDKCTFVVDVRSNECYSNEELLEQIKASVNCDVAARSTRLGSSSISEDHPLVQKGKALGLPVFGSATLSNSAVCPFPALKIGPGDTKRSHTPNEYIMISELEQAKELYIKLLMP